MASSYLLRMVCGPRKVFVNVISKSEGEPLTYDDFIEAAANNFGFEDSNFECFQDENGFLINQQIFLKVLEGFKDTLLTNFCLRVVLRSETNNTPSRKRKIDTIHDQVTSKDLSDYLKERKSGSLIEEYEEHKVLTDKSRRYLITLAVDFLESKFGNYPQKSAKEAVAKACIELFPHYETKNSKIGGFDLFYDGDKGGYLQVRLKNLQKKRLSAVRHIQKDVETSGYSTLLEDALRFLKNAECPKQNIAIKIKLKETLKYRSDLLEKDKDINIFENFPFFFNDVSLITYEYQLLFENHFDKWELFDCVKTNIQLTLDKLSISSVKCDEGAPDWPESIINFLSLLKLLPPTSIGRQTTARDTFDKQVQAFIILQKDDISDGDQFNTKHPLIVAYGANRGAIEKFFIAYNKQLIKLPEEYSFDKVFDIFFKSHFVFRTTFHPILKNFLVFFQHFGYCHEGVKTTTRMKEVNVHISKIQVDEEVF